MTNGLYRLIAISFGSPHCHIFSVGPIAMTERPEKSTRLPRRFWRKRPCFPLSECDSDFKERPPAPVIGLERRPLSIKASTASCNIRFSFCTMIAGVPSSKSFFRRLLRVMTRRYRSFRSLVAKRPPSSCNIGLKSGGIIGRTVKIIHSGLLLELRNDSTVSRRLISFLRLSPLAFSSSAEISVYSFSISTCRRRTSSASAPVFAVKLSGP